VVAAGNARLGRLRLGAVLLVGPAVLALAACGSSDNKSNAAASTLPTSSAPTATSTAAPTVTVTVTPTGLPRCHTSQLAASIPNAGGGAAGHIVGYVEFTNTGGVTCRMYGYPGLGLLDSSGHAIPITVTRGGGQGQETTATPSSLTLAPNAAAHAEYNYTDVPTGSQTTCPAAAKLQVTPPDETDFLLVTAQLAPCGGEIHVGPVIAGAPPTN
jgi:hypothetical protein